MYYVYVLKCSDGTFYTGVSKDIKKRLKEHNGLLKGGAKYTSGRRPVALIYFEKLNNLSDALKRELEIKKMKRTKKESLVNVF